MACLLCPRTLVWTTCWTAMLISTIAPFFFDDMCWVDKYGVAASARSTVLHGLPYAPCAPRIWNHFGAAIMIGMLATVFMGPRGRFDFCLDMHRCAGRYAVVICAHCCTCLAAPWTICASYQMADPVRTAIFWGTWIASQMLLIVIGVKRLRLVKSQDKYIRRLKLCTAFAAIFSIAAAAVYVCSLLFNAGIAFMIAVATMISFALVSYIGLQWWLYLGFCISAQEAEVESRGTTPAIRRARWSARMAAASGVTTVVWVVVCLLLGPTVLKLRSVDRPGFCWLFELLPLVDICSDVCFALLCAGLVGPKGNRVTELHQIGRLVHERRQRQILMRMHEAADAMIGPAAILAALFEGEDVKTLLTQAQRRFRFISWDNLRTQSHLIVGGGALEGATNSAALYHLSQACDLGTCDAFFSHSWHDDGKQKWEVLKAWCENFIRSHGRSPRLWFDKVCINQTDIQSDLQCLPIFLAGCNTLLIVCGDAYISRLWCCTECFVYMSMLVMNESRTAPVVRLLGANIYEKQGIVATWQNFDFHMCQCFKPDDKQRIVAVIERHREGGHEFNTFIRGLGQQLLPTELSRSGEQLLLPSVI